jgi:hypothetical protein
MPRSRHGLGVLCVCVSAGVLATCGGKSPTRPTTPSVSSAATNVVVSGLPTAALAPGDRVQLGATATYADGSTRDVTAAATWGTSNAGVLAVSASGLITAVAIGDAEISAAFSAVVGRVVAQVREALPAFRVATLLSAARQPSAADLERVFLRANQILLLKTGERMSQVDLATPAPGSPVSQAQAYVSARASGPPDGVLVLSDDATATSAGGYSSNVPLPPPNQNHFPSPIVGSGRAYVAVVDFFHMYARCGYDSQGHHVSGQSSGGECRSRSGLVCVNNGEYWMCPDALNDLYADRDYFAACTIVHEFMHPFGPAGNFDHYGTDQCRARTGMSAADAANLTLAQQSCGMCPDVYGSFKRR